jgi:ADP-heptose:LPS heptosyltransferase
MFKNIPIKAFILRAITKKIKVDFDLKNTKKVLFLRYDRIGDMIITTPVFRELKQAYPGIEITVLASRTNQDVILANPYVDNIVINNKNNILGDLLLLFKLRKCRFDACIELDHSVVPHAIIRLKIINSKKVISVKKDGRYGVKGSELSLYDIYTKKPVNEHLRNILLLTIEPFGVSPKSNKYDLYLTEKQKEKAQNFLKQYGVKTLVGINLEGAVKGKVIDFIQLFQICNGLFKVDKNIQIIIIASPKNFKRVKRKILKTKLDYLDVSYKTDTIIDAAAIINEMDLIITPDTSIAHVASALNRPVVTIHEKNFDSYELFAPTSDLAKTVFSKSKNSLNGFSVNLVLELSLELLSKNKLPS